MFANKSTSMLFTEICGVFFHGHEEYYRHYYDDKGILKYSSKARNTIPTYMLHNIKGEVVIADSGLRVESDIEKEPANNNFYLSFETPKRTRKIGVLFQSPYQKELRVKWIAIEEEGMITAVHPYRDLHRDLSIIAKRIGIKPNKVRFA